MPKRPVIAVDAMGGDQAPQAVIEGAIQASRQFGIEILLVGNQHLIANRLKQLSASHLPISIQHAPDAITMNDNPLDVMRKKKGSSISVGMGLVAQGRAQAIFSAGNSGAVVSAALYILKRIKGIDRPAIATLMPSLRGRVLFADAGANTVCKPYHLAQFAIMCASFFRSVFKNPCPRVGLLSNGEEDSKGTDCIKSAHALLKNCSLTYTGYVEGSSVFGGNVDIVICDGFTGNVVLKTAEGVAECFNGAIQEELRCSWIAIAGSFLSRTSFKALKKRFDYSEYGGAPLLGVNGAVIIGHGKSSANAVKNGIRVAREMIDSKVVYHLQNDLDVNKDLQTVGRKPSLMKRVFQTSSS